MVPTVTLAVNEDQNSLLRVGQRVSSHYLLQVFHVIVRKPSWTDVTETGLCGLNHGLGMRQKS